MGHGGLQSSASSITTVGATISSHATDETPRGYADLSAANLSLRDGIERKALLEDDGDAVSSSDATSNPSFVTNRKSILYSVPSVGSPETQDQGNDDAEAEAEERSLHEVSDHEAAAEENLA